MNDINNGLNNACTQSQFSPEQIQMVKQMLNSRGMTAEQMVKDICRQRGINVDDFMKQFK